MCSPTSPSVLRLLVKWIWTQSPSLARIASGWIGSSLRPIETFWEACSARTAATRSLSTNMRPCGSLSPKRLSGIVTLIACTSKVFSGAPSGQGAPGPAPAAASWTPLCANTATGATTMTAMAPRSAIRAPNAVGTPHDATRGARHGARRRSMAQAAIATGRFTASTTSASRVMCATSGRSLPPWWAPKSVACSGLPRPVAAAAATAVIAPSTSVAIASDISAPWRSMIPRASTTASQTAAKIAGRPSVESRSQCTSSGGSPFSVPPSTLCSTTVHSPLV